MLRISRIITVLALVGATSGCAIGLHSPNISEIRRNPGRWQDRTVSINGIVTNSWGVPLMPFRMYRVDDGTGDVTVVSQGSRTPIKGEHVRVKGRVNDVGVLGGQALGLHLREESLYVKR